jgi:hypothetical protein
VERLLRDALGIAARLGLRWYERVALIVTVALVAALLRRVIDALGEIRLVIEPSPEPISDGGVAEDRDLAPSVLVAEEPSVIVPGEPGGGPTGGMG